MYLQKCVFVSKECVCVSDVRQIYACVSEIRNVCVSDVRQIYACVSEIRNVCVSDVRKIYACVMK